MHNGLETGILASIGLVMIENNWFIVSEGVVSDFLHCTFLTLISYTGGLMLKFLPGLHECYF